MILWSVRFDQVSLLYAIHICEASLSNLVQDAVPGPFYLKGLLEHGAQANWCFKLVSQFSKHLGLPEWCNAKEKPEMLLMLLS